MAVITVTPVIRTDDTVPADRFYGDFLRLDIVGDQDGIVSYGDARGGTVDVVVARPPESSEPVPDLSIEVQQIERLLARAEQLGFDIVTPMIRDEGPLRFYVRDPFGKIVRLHS